MTRPLRGWVAALLALGLAAGLGSARVGAEEPALAPAQEEAVRAIIQDYLLEHPEVLVEALERYQARQKAEEAKRQSAAVAANREALERDPLAPVLGNPEGDVTVVEFFDYRCPYCKRVVNDLIDTAEADGNVRVVMKEFPILGPQSLLAARAALAAARQDKYQEIHVGLMSLKGEVDESAVMALAESLGLDVERLKRDMSDEEVDRAIRANYELADALGIGGTPAFIVGDTLIPGAIDAERLRELIAKARAR